MSAVRRDRRERRQREGVCLLLLLILLFFHLLLDVSEHATVEDGEVEEVVKITASSFVFELGFQ